MQGFILDSVTHPKWAVVLANIAILIHVLTAFQVFAQAVFDTLESHAKWFLLRRAERKLLEAEAATAQGSPTKAPAATTGSFIAPSPFGDQPRGPAPRISAMMGYQKSSLPPLEERLSSRMSSGMSGRISTPKAAAKGAQGSTSESLPGSEERDTVQDLPDIVHATLPVLPTRSGHQSFSMYGLDTGLANEEVPLNTERVLAPLWVRLLVRSLYVALVTLITVIMPFFSAISGLVGSIIFWPLIVHFPVVCYRKVYGRANRGLDVVLSIIYWGFLVVCIAAVVASFYTLVQEWQTFKVS